MTNLPINTNIAPAQAPGKPASSDDAAQGSSGFGDVLARQVTDTAPADKKADTNTKEKKVDAASTDATSTPPLAGNPAALPPDITNALQGDMLAALLVQQNQNSTTQAALNFQPAVTTQRKSDTPEAPLTAVADKDSNALKLAMATPEKAALPQGQLAAVDGQKPAALSVPAGQQKAAPSADKDSPNFANILKTSGSTEALSSLGREVSRNVNLTEISATAQQSGALASAQAATTANSIRDVAASGPLAVHTPLAQTGWGNEFSQKVTWLATQRDQSAELHINPPHLGPLDVVIKVSADQATALFTSPHSAVREAIEQALPRLREMLADNGIMLGNATVSDQAPRKDSNEFSRSQQAFNTHADATGDSAVTAITSTHNASRHNGMVDTFA